MSKIAEPYVCDGPSCGKRRDTDANHWWLINRDARDGAQFVAIIEWRADAADYPGIKHVCGIDCAMKVAGCMAAEIVDGNKNSSTGKDVQRGQEE